ncbi:unnamed protein product [Zymoseptoria tritici ST99CH_1A5]|uniref:Uncharacterized protein n=1 Tax=Zymoseptoria tritici ST99CH_1A5 TaxID=1276529 RepID=A0A1Y6M0N1_ZYMTR|nr:unnamed protein product [Zymoseptoria tritici ST99CH_1A5]
MPPFFMAPIDVHFYYGGELGVLGSLSNTKALACPVAVYSRGSFVSCQGALGLTRTNRITHLLEDLHFHKSQMDGGSNKIVNACIARVAMLIVENTFCSKHDPHKHKVDFDSRLESVFDKALKCPIFPDATDGQDYAFKRVFTQMQHTINPRTPHNSKHSREEEDNDTLQPPAPKRVRPLHDDSVLQWSDTIYQDTWPPSHSDIAGEANDGDSSVFTTNTSPVDNNTDFPWLSRDDPLWSSITLQQSEGIMAGLSPYHSDGPPPSPSAEKLTRNNNINNTITYNEHFEPRNSASCSPQASQSLQPSHSLPSPQSSQSSQISPSEDIDQWINELFES